MSRMISPNRKRLSRAVRNTLFLICLVLAAQAQLTPAQTQAEPGEIVMQAGHAATVWALEFEHGKLLYGFPASESGIKVAIHYGGVQRTTAEQIDRSIHDEDSTHLRAYADRYLPGVLGEIARAEVCMYTNTPDLHFIFDAHPRHASVLVVSACSGHGFKFSSAIGEAAAQWAQDGAPALDLSLFSLRRFSA